MASIVDRILARLDTTDPRSCWTWTGGKAGAGYGILSGVYVHRATYERFVGPIPDGLEIDHVCRNRACANPAHLEAVTHAENRRRARSATCKRGHVLADGRDRPGHGRVCRQCDAIRAANYRRRKVAA